MCLVMVQLYHLLFWCTFNRAFNTKNKVNRSISKAMRFIHPADMYLFVQAEITYIRSMILRGAYNFIIWAE